MDDRCTRVLPIRLYVVFIVSQPDNLNFAIMAEGRRFSKWMADCIDELLNINGLELKLLIIEGDFDEDNKNSSSGIRSKISTFNRYRKRTSTKDAVDFATFFYYKKLTGASIGPNSALETCDLNDRLSTVDRIVCNTREDGFSEYFAESDLKRIASYDLDFILRDAFGIIRGDILELPEYGVWSFHHQNEQKYRGSPPGLWELIEGDPVTGAILQRLTERLDGGIVLRRGFFRTQDNWSDNINHVFYGTVEWPAQVAKNILQGNDNYVHENQSSTDAPIYRNPSVYDLFKLHKNDILSKVRQLKKGRDNWNIGIINAKLQDILKGDILEIDWFPIKRKDGFIADPFFAEIDGQEYIFVENYSYKTQKGTISYIEYPDGFDRGELHHAHEEDTHISYPHIFTHSGTTYCTPEMHSSEEVRLYRIEAPNEWIHETTLLEGVPAADPTVFHYNGQWWLFFTRSDNLRDGERYQHTKLFVYYSNDLFDGWKPHYNNPVKTDIRSSRPGGTPFTLKNSLYRPAQDCVREYGRKLAINKITELSTKIFEEKTVNKFRITSTYPRGTHHISANPTRDLFVIDAKRYIWDKDLIERKINNTLSLILR